MTILNLNFGIELEYVGGVNSRSAVASAISQVCTADANAIRRDASPVITAETFRAWRAQASSYGHTSSRWDVKTDGSLSGANAGEITSPILPCNGGIDHARRVVSAVAGLGCTANRTCGFHVHLGVQSGAVPLATLRNFACMYAKWEHVLDMLQPRSRRASSNTYCKSMLYHHGFNASESGLARRIETGGAEAVRTIEAERVMAINAAMERIRNANTVSELAQVINRGDRYHKLNLQSYSRYGTIEVRHHGGTMNADKVCHWVTMLLCLMDRCHAGIKYIKPAIASGRTDAEQFQEFAVKFMPPATRTFYARRRAELARNRTDAETGE